MTGEMSGGANKPLIVDDVERAIDEIVARVGKRIAIGVPLGLGKPVQLLNALYARARADSSLHLKVLTALSLEKPSGATSLERAFLKPFVERVFGDCPDLDYLPDLRAGKLPANVEICEFFFTPGKFLGNAHAQQHYISSNYTHAARDVFAQGCNVAAQIVCKRADGKRYSMSCNPDTTPELVSMLRASGRPHTVVALVNQNLPYMGNDAELSPDFFDVVVDHARYATKLFSTPKLAITTPDYLIGLHASTLIRDGGTLQVGIGALGDAIVYATLLRHQRNEEYRRALNQAGVVDRHDALIRYVGGVTPFSLGLYGATEMFVDGFMHLRNAGVLTRRVFDFWALQQVINEGHCDPEDLQPAVLDALDALGLRVIRTKDFEVLQHHGFFNDATRYDQGYLVAPDGERVIANVADPKSRAVMAAKCLGKKLRNGYVAHGGFFLGPNAFYDWLRELPDEERAQICMTGVDKINQLDLNPRLYKLQRKDARFMNTGLMVTLSGSVVSDGLENGGVISGVGGQYNFVAMAHQLLTGRSIIMIRAVRESGGKASSNVVFNYGHSTISRHLRDLVITEYGIADLRSKTDSEIVKAMVNIADSRFQDGLLAQARAAGKVEADYVIPAEHRQNTPERLEAALAGARQSGLFPEFPLGCDFTDEELKLAKALRKLKARVDATPKWRLLPIALRRPQVRPEQERYLERLALAKPRSLQDRIARNLLLEELNDV